MPSKLIKKQVAGNELRKKLLVAAIAAASANYTVVGKQPNKARRQMVWQERVASLSAKEFERRYRMDLEGFNQVLEKIRPAFGPMCENVPTQVPPELKLSMALRWMAGGSYLDIADLHGVDESTFYKHLWPTIEAIDAAYELPLLAMLDNVEAGSLGPLIDAFDEKSAGMIRGCFGALDGIAVKIEKPDTADAASYYCRKGFYSVRHPHPHPQVQLLTLCGPCAADQLPVRVRRRASLHLVLRTHVWIDARLMRLLVLTARRDPRRSQPSGESHRRVDQRRRCLQRPSQLQRLDPHALPGPQSLRRKGLLQLLAKPSSHRN